MSDIESLAVLVPSSWSVVDRRSGKILGSVSMETGVAGVCYRAAIAERPLGAFTMLYEARRAVVEAVRKGSDNP